jgi:hypothetical protein
MSGRLPIRASNNDAIIAAIEKDRPARPGHHTSHQTKALMKWLKEHEKKGGKSNG